MTLEPESIGSICAAWFTVDRFVRAVVGDATELNLAQQIERLRRIDNKPRALLQTLYEHRNNLVHEGELTMLPATFCEEARRCLTSLELAYDRASQQPKNEARVFGVVVIGWLGVERLLKKYTPHLSARATADERIRYLEPRLRPATRKALYAAKEWRNRLLKADILVDAVSLYPPFTAKCCEQLHDDIELEERRQTQANAFAQEQRHIWNQAGSLMQRVYWAVQLKKIKKNELAEFDVSALVRSDKWCMLVTPEAQYQWLSKHMPASLTELFNRLNAERLAFMANPQSTTLDVDAWRARFQTFQKVMIEISYGRWPKTV